MKLIKFVLILVFSICISCNTSKTIEEKKNNESIMMLETMERMFEVIDELNIFLDEMIKRLNENENEIRKLIEDINELKNMY